MNMIPLPDQEAGQHEPDRATTVTDPNLERRRRHIARLVGIATLAVLAVLVLVFLLARFISSLGGATRRASVPWLCGYAREAECNRYVAHGFYGEIKRYFRWLGGAPATQTEKAADTEGTLK